jgi:hypothetical protein
MSKIQVDTIVNKDDNGAPDFPFGATVVGIVTASGANFTGIVTASGFVDDGTNLLTEVNKKASTGKAIAMAMVFG